MDEIISLDFKKENTLRIQGQENFKFLLFYWKIIFTAFQIWAFLQMYSEFWVSNHIFEWANTTL